MHCYARRFHQLPLVSTQGDLANHCFIQPQGLVTKVVCAKPSSEKRDIHRMCPVLGDRQKERILDWPQETESI